MRNKEHGVSLLEVIIAIIIILLITPWLYGLYKEKTNGLTRTFECTRSDDRKVLDCKGEGREKNTVILVLMREGEANEEIEYTFSEELNIEVDIDEDVKGWTHKWKESLEK